MANQDLLQPLLASQPDRCMHPTLQETTKAWKKAEAETVRAEHAAQVSRCPSKAWLACPACPHTLITRR